MANTTCYFSNPTVFEEGRRYLVLLRVDPANTERFRGLGSGCALDVLVASDYHYAVRLPITGLKLAEDLTGVSNEYEFKDPYAQVTDETMKPAHSQALLEQGLLKPFAPTTTNDALDSSNPLSRQREWIYTRGVDLTAFRRLMLPIDIPNQATIR